MNYSLERFLVSLIIFLNIVYLVSNLYILYKWVNYIISILFVLPSVFRNQLGGRGSRIWWWGKTSLEGEGDYFLPF